VYSQAPHPVVEPFCWPCRTEASHEFERTEPFQVKVSVWLCPTPLLSRGPITALDDWLMLIPCVDPVLPIPPGSASDRLPEASAMFELPVTPLVSDRPLQPARSFVTRISPTREVLMSSR